VVVYVIPVYAYVMSWSGVERNMCMVCNERLLINTQGMDIKMLGNYIIILV
jgi:hypothetical protein